MTARADILDRTLLAAQELRAAAAETRRALQAARDLVERSRRQARIAAIPTRDVPAPGADDPGPSQPLVACLVRAHELAEDDGEPRTRALLDRVIAHVGHRIAVTLGPRAAEIVMH